MWKLKYASQRVTSLETWTLPKILCVWCASAIWEAFSVKQGLLTPHRVFSRSSWGAADCTKSLYRTKLCSQAEFSNTSLSCTQLYPCLGWEICLHFHHHFVLSLPCLWSYLCYSTDELIFFSSFWPLFNELPHERYLMRAYFEALQLFKPWETECSWFVLGSGLQTSPNSMVPFASLSQDRGLCGSPNIIEKKSYLSR